MKKAEWIWLNDKFNKDEYAVFKDGFTHTGDGKVSIKISASGDYNLFLNGALLAFSQYPDYSEDKIYDEIDITGSTVAGKNEIKIIVWNIGESFSTGIAKRGSLYYEVKDSGGVIACSSENVECALAKDYCSYLKKIITVQLGYSYRYDMRGAYADCEWKKAVRVAGYKNFSPRPNLRPYIGGTVLGKSVGKNAIYDLGRETCGFLTVKLKGESGKLIKIAYGEHLADGGVRYEIDGRDFTVELIMNGETTEFTGCLRRLGCRYLQIIGDCEVSYIGIKEVLYPFRQIPYKAENGLRQKIYDAAVNTLKLCYHDHYEDCPWREQAMYLMDSYIQMRCGYVAFENRECMRAAIKAFINGQKDSGLFELCFPAEVPITIASFALIFPAIILEYGQNTGDWEFVKEALPAAERAVGYFLDRIDANGLYKTRYTEDVWNFYEWADGLDGEFFSEEKRHKDCYDCLINAFLSSACGKMQKLYICINIANRAEWYEGWKNSLNGAIYKLFFVSGTGLFKNRDEGEEYSVLANSLAILCGASPEKESVFIAEKLARGCDFMTQNTLSTNIFLFDALLKVNKNKYFSVILDKIDKTYGKMLELGATSFWETVLGEKDFSGAGSLCHGWSAIPVCYYKKPL